MKEKIGVGIIGTGFARRTQIPAFKDLKNAEVVSVASASLENAQSAANEFKIEHFTDDWKETILRDNVDLISITTPPVLHREMTLFAFEHNKHVLCEKPMAMNAFEAKEMTEKADEKGVMALIDHELRFTNGRMKAFQMIREGKIGKIQHAKYHFCNATRSDVNSPWTWWSDEAQGGGALGAIGSHVIDTFRWFLETEIKEIFCRMHTHVKRRPLRGRSEKLAVTTDDETLMILKFGANDLVSDTTAIASLSMVEAGNYRNTVEFFGTKGALRIDDDGDISFADINRAKWVSIDFELGGVAPKMKDVGWSKGFVKFSAEIAKTLLAGETTVQNAATFEDGLQIQRVLDAARESDKKGVSIVI